jgi:RNA polymerase sigma-70 factor (ECF subfamily)
MPRPRSETPSVPAARRPDEPALLARVARGDRDAFAALYRRYQRPLAAYLARLTGGLEGVDELVDDTLLVVWRRAGSFAGRSRPSTWIFGIAYRKALKALEKRSRRRDDAALGTAGEPVERHTPEGAWDRRERAALVTAALEHLSPEQRAVVVLTYYQGLSYPEIADLVGCPLGTVKTRMFHARRKLAALLPELGVDGGAEEAP